MSDKINHTASASPHDYATTLRSMSDTTLTQQTATNYWCWKHLQQTEIDYKARYLACITAQQQREHAKHTT